MAEAAVDKQSNSQLLKYFCHQCSDSVEITVATDATNLTCPKCASSFIEEMTQELENDHLQTDAGNERDSLLFLRGSNPSGLLSSMLLSLNSMNQEDDDDDDDDDLLTFMHERPLSLSSATSPSQSTSAAGRGGQLSPFHRFLETLLGNLRAGSTGTSVDQSASFQFGFPSYLQGFHGDPRDYAWGADGIDNIITELLNQTEGAGPPPATKEDIDTLPSTTITQDSVDRAAQCPVCLENFLLDETVKCLPCEHVFHSSCVVPWLQLHRTCPICRTPVGGEAESDYAAPSSDMIDVGSVNSLIGQEPRRLSSSSSSGSMFQDAIEEPGQHMGLRADTFMEANFPDDLESFSDMEV